MAVFTTGLISYLLRPALSRWMLQRQLNSNNAERTEFKNKIADTCARSLHLSHLLEGLSPELLALDALRSPGCAPQHIIDQTFNEFHGSTWHNQPRFIRNRLYSSIRKRLLHVLIDIFENYNDVLLAHKTTQEWFREQAVQLNTHTWIGKMPTHFNHSNRFWWHLVLLSLLGSCVGLAGQEHGLSWLVIASIAGVAVFQVPPRKEINWTHFACQDLAPQGIAFFQSKPNTQLLEKVIGRRCDFLLGSRERATLQLILGPFQYHVWRQHLHKNLVIGLKEALADPAITRLHQERVEHTIPQHLRTALQQKLESIITHEVFRLERWIAWIILCITSSVSLLYWV